MGIIYGRETSFSYAGTLRGEAKVYCAKSRRGFETVPYINSSGRCVFIKFMLCMCVCVCVFQFGFMTACKTKVSTTLSSTCKLVSFSCGLTVYNSCSTGEF